MGARTYIIKEVEQNKFIAVYNHWGASKISRWASEGLGKKIYNKINEMWEESIKEEKDLVKKLNGIQELYEFIDFTDIPIEVYPILWRNKELTVFLTLIRNFVNGAIRFESRNNNNPWALHGAFMEREKAEAIIDFLEVMNYEKETAEEMIRKGWLRMKHKGVVTHDLVIAKNLKEAIEKHRTLPLRNFLGIIYY